MNEIQIAYTPLLHNPINEVTSNTVCSMCPADELVLNGSHMYSIHLLYMTSHMSISDNQLMEETNCTRVWAWNTIS